MANKFDAAREAFTLAKGILADMEDLMTKLGQLAQEESLTTMERHMVMDQIVSLFEAPAKALKEYPDRYLESDVQHCILTRCKGLKITSYDEDGNDGPDELYVAGMNYEWKRTRKVEILNKDAKSWVTLINLLIGLGKATAIQQRLTLSMIDDEETLKALGGLVNVLDDGRWSVTKPTEPKNKVAKK